MHTVYLCSVTVLQFKWPRALLLLFIYLFIFIKYILQMAVSDRKTQVPRSRS